MKKNITVCLIFLFTAMNYGQSKSEIKQAIETIEDISQQESQIGPMRTKTTTKVIFSESLGKVEQIVNLDFVGEKDYSKNIMTFYIEDVIPDSMIYDFYPIKENDYWVDIRIKTKSKSVELTKESSTAPNYFPITDTEYTDTIKFYGASRTMSKFLMNKYLESVRILVGANKFTKKDFIKADISAAFVEGLARLAGYFKVGYFDEVLVLDEGMFSLQGTDPTDPAYLLLNTIMSNITESDSLPDYASDTVAGSLIGRLLALQNTNLKIGG